ncbi:LPS-assembly protein LptD [Arenibaculum pallidiluteum]|uniref:LPS-assembly protein LptD n=1 Tax=Arenibaculum pallidiluteum TaxID=2812559 RepID=UPI001A978575|nr:LPS assembly protein LptD [Arenibaculum pallidiluteum]
MSSRFRLALLSGLIVAGALAAAGARAQQPQAQAPAQPPAGAPGSQEPVLLNADTLTYDEQLNVVVASGKVEMAQGDRVLLADSVTFNRSTDVVTATGNVVMLEPTAEVYFADYVELTRDMKEGFIQGVRALLSDNSRMAAPEGERTQDGRYTRLNNAVYSPCNLCAKDPTRPPLWQVKAVRVVHDRDEKNVYYRDAWLEMFGVPTFYTPFLSHPDPSVEQRSGFLAPTFSLGGNLGGYASVPYYIGIAPDKDLTLAPSYSSEDGPRLAGTYRQRFGRGELRLDGSILNADRIETITGTPVRREDQWRGHLFGNARVDLDDTWRAGAQIQRTSDDTYLQRYGVSSQSLLRSSAIIEGFRGRNYAAASGYYFQDLRPFVTSSDEPLILPLGEVSLLGDPGSALGGRWSLDLGMLGLHRDEGTNVRRLSSEAGWERTMISGTGLVTTITASTRADFYDVELVNQARAPGENGDDQTLRLFPQAQITTRYPMATEIGTVQAVVDPVVQLTVAPRLGTDPAIPNEDSATVDFADTNLFRASRYAGIDRLETGSRITYGVETGVYGFGSGFSDLFLGQSYRLIDEQGFPRGSGLEDRASDFVGRLRIQPNDYFRTTTRFRLDSDNLEQRLTEVTASGGVPALRVGVVYRYTDEVTGPAGRPEDESLIVNATSRLNRYWSVGVAQSRDLDQERPVESLLVGTYADECLIFQISASRNHTLRRVESDTGTAVFFRLIFKNLGEFEAPLTGGTRVDPGSPQF